MFINYKNGKATINTYRHAQALATDVEDIIEAKACESTVHLTANLDIWIGEQIEKVKKELSEFKCLNKNDVSDLVLSNYDFLDVLNENLEIDHAEYPDLRDKQYELIEEYFEG